MILDGRLGGYGLGCRTEVLIGVVDRLDVDICVTGGFNRGAVVIERSGMTGRLLVGVKTAPDGQIAAAE